MFEDLDKLGVETVSGVMVRLRQFSQKTESPLVFKKHEATKSATVAYVLSRKQANYHVA